MKSYFVLLCGLVAALFLSIASHAGVNTFTPTGPQGGWANTVYYIPGSAGVALATNADGLFRTTDNGLTWRRVFSNIFNAQQRLIVTDPRNASHVVFQAEQLGIHISDDAGLTFRSIGAYPPTNMTNARSMAYSANGLATYVIFGTKVLRSTDGGITWAPTAADIPTTDFAFSSDLVVAPNDQDTVYASIVGTPARIYKTTNGGQSWSPLGLSRAFVKLAIDPTAPNVLLGAAFDGIQRSADGGATWSAVSGESTSVIQFDPVIAGRVFAVSQYGKILRSVNGGVTWATLIDLKTWTPMSLSFDTTKAGRIMYGSADGIQVSEDAGVTWEAKNAGLYGGTFSLTTHRPSRSVFARGDPSPLGLFGRDSTGNWNSLGLPAILSIAQSPQLIAGIRALAVASDDATVLYAARNYSLMKSTDGGVTWTTPTADLRNDAVWSIAIDPTTPATLYAATYPRGILRSLDGGVTWAARGSGMLSNDSRFVMIDPKNPATLYATTIEPRLYKSTNAGLDWSAVTIPANNAAYYNVQLDPVDSNTLYVASSDGVWRSDNAGSSWSKVANTSAYVREVAIDPDMPSVVILNGSPVVRGIQRSIDKGATWEVIPFPFGASFSGNVAIDPRNSANILYSLGYDGIYQIEISPDLELKSSSLLIANSAPQTVTLQLTNKGPYGATSLKLSADVPTGAQNVSVQTDKGTCTLATLHIDCTLAAMKNSEAMTVTVMMTTASTAGQLTASVSAREPDPAMANNSLSIVPTAPPPPAPPPESSSGGGALQWWTLMALGMLMAAGQRNGQSRWQSRH